MWKSSLFLVFCEPTTHPPTKILEIVNEGIELLEVIVIRDLIRSVLVN